MTQQAGFSTPGIRLSARRARWCLAVLAIAVGYFLLPNARPDLTIFNANDSESYIALSYALTHGLGYTRNLAPNLYIPHTTWPPGMPGLLAPVMAVSHLPVDWFAIKSSVILIGLVGMALAWLYVWRITQSAVAANLATLLLALEPFYWLFSRMALTEVPTVAFVLFGLLMVDLVWAARRPSIWQVALVGIACGMGMLIRGTVCGLIFTPLAYGFGARRARVSRPRLAWLSLFHAAGFCLAFLVWAARNHTINANGLGLDGIDQLRMLFASNPVDPTSGLVTLAEVWRNLVDNVLHRIIYHIPEQMLPGLWNANWQNWPHAYLLASALTLLLGLAALPRTSRGLPLFIVLCPYTVMMLVYAWGGSIRFWIPIASLLTVLVVMSLEPYLSRLRTNHQQQLLAGVSVAYGLSLLLFIHNFEANPYLGDLGDMVTLFEQVRALPKHPIMTLTEHPALFTLETGYVASMAAPGIGIDPRYTNLITREQPTGYADSIPAPPGAMEELHVAAWHMYGLPTPMTLHEIRSSNRCSPCIRP